MKNVLLLFIVGLLFSCKKPVDLSETHWTLYYKHNPTFSFYAESDLYFKKDNIIENARNFDTLTGTWYADKKKLNIYFTNDDKYEGTIVSSDSITGTLLLPSGDHGTWFAKRK